MATRFTTGQRQDQVTKVNALRKQGMSAAAACKKAKVNINNYNYWMRAGKKTKGTKRVLKAGTKTVAKGTGMKAFYVNLAGGKNQPMVIAIGQPKDVNTALANLAAMFSGSSA